VNVAEKTSVHMSRAPAPKAKLFSPGTKSERLSLLVTLGPASPANRPGHLDLISPGHPALSAKTHDA